MTNTKSEQANVLDNSTVINSFFEYANYLLFGKIDNSEVNPFDINQVYEIDKSYNNIDYLNTLNDLYNGFFQLSEETPNDLFREIPAAKIKEYINFLIWHAQIEPLSETNLSEKYGSGGKESAETYISDYYESTEKEDNYLSRLFVDFDKKRAMAILDYWENNEPSMELGEAETSMAELFLDITRDLKYQCNEFIKIYRGINSNEN